MLTPLSGSAAFERFSEINSNPINFYRGGYEFYMSYLPQISDEDSIKQKAQKLVIINSIMGTLAKQLINTTWIFENWPTTAPFNRTILAIDEQAGVELIMARWNNSETPIHGHEYGIMVEFLVEGKATETIYQANDNGEVAPVGSINYYGRELMSSDYYRKENLKFGAHIHKFAHKKGNITLHLMPGHPRDGKGNIFTEIKTV